MLKFKEIGEVKLTFEKKQNICVVDYYRNSSSPLNKTMTSAQQEHQHMHEVCNQVPNGTSIRLPNEMETLEGYFVNWVIKIRFIFIWKNLDIWIYVTGSHVFHVLQNRSIHNTLLLTCRPKAPKKTYSSLPLFALSKK